MLKFAIPNLVPTGNRYFYVVPETGVRLEDLAMSRLITKVNAHYASNKLPVPANLLALVQDHMCKYMPEGFCHGSDDGAPRPRVVTLAQIRDNTTKLASGNPRVRPGLARQRAEICSRCPKNDKSMCPTCIGLVAWSRKLSGGNLGGVDDVLGVCGVDATSISAKVHLTNIPADSAYPAHCWKVTEHA